jgi:UDP-N-acetylglucosamine diphosphorylase / glucose-1-phosphate thymidylyltransferase / UDP-N-acetylgalactosamine diphosphorylase / glucosamine-1-phosphate N-acetyltransferase / galactosamine-1-phosphate N-acetyltransferase
MVSRETYGPRHFFRLQDVWFSDLFSDVDFPWEVLAPKRKEEWIRKQLRSNVGRLSREKSGMVLTTYNFPVEDGEAVVEAGSIVVGDEIELRAGVRVEAGAWLTGPTILGPGTIVRHGAYVRGGILTGKSVLIGHTSEVKSSIFLNEAKAPHFAYVGDSILGNGVNLGAGTKVSNLKITNDEVVLRIENTNIRTGLRKMGAILGDGTETGCNSVLNPGVLLAKKCLVYPAVAVRKMYYKEGSVIR